MLDGAGIALSETVLYGFMIFNGLFVIGLLIFFWRRGSFNGLSTYNLKDLMPDDEKGEL